MRRDYSPLQHFAVSVVKPTMTLAAGREWSGRENVPRSGGMILAANHLSWTDPLAISHFLHDSGRWPVFLAKSELFDAPVLGGLLGRLAQIPVYRGTGEAGQALAGARRALEGGACVIFYPEGTCTRDPGLWPMLGKTGAAQLAIVTGVPVIPLAHWGPHALLPYGEKKPHLRPRKVMRVAAGPPVDLSAYRGLDPTAPRLRAATQDITAAITALLADIRGEAPPSAPYNPRAARLAPSTKAPGSPRETHESRSASDDVG